MHIETLKTKTIMTQNKDIFPNFKACIASVILLIIMQSCGTKKDILYFQDAKTDTTYSNTFSNSKIQINDILDIKVSTKINDAAAPFNTEIFASAASNIDILKIKGYLVDTQGFINFPVLGTLFVSDKSTSELETFIKQKLIHDDLLLDAVVTIRLLNAKITVLGEVNKPGTFSITEQNITLLQALGLAGDLTINGQRNDVLLIRMEGTKKTITKIDMTKTDWFNSPNFFVKNNDVIVVSPNNSKIKMSGYLGNPTTILTIASLLLSSIILITR